MHFFRSFQAYMLCFSTLFLFKIEFSFHATNLKTDCILYIMSIYTSKRREFQIRSLIFFMQHFEFVNSFVFFQQCGIKLKKYNKKLILYHLYIDDLMNNRYLELLSSDLLYCL